MSELPPDGRFTSFEELLAYLREHSDDVDEVIIPVQEGVQLAGPAGEIWRVKEDAALLRMCDGSRLTIHRQMAEALLNDGILARVRIPVILVPPSSHESHSPEAQW